MPTQPCTLPLSEASGLFPVPPAAVDRSQQRLHAIVTTMAEGLMVIDAVGRLVQCNPAASRLLGCAGEIEIGSDLRDLSHQFVAFSASGTPLELADWPLMRALQGEALVPQELRVRRLATGEERTFVCSGGPLCDLEGQVEFAFLIIRDVTDQRRAEAEMRRVCELLSAVAENITDAIFVKDHEGRYQFFNPAASRFVGLPVEAVLDKDDTALFDAASARVVMERDRRVMATGQAETEEECLTAGGSTRTFLATKAPYRDHAGQVIGTIGISRDITARKSAERRLARQAELQALLLEITRAIIADGRDPSALGIRLFDRISGPLGVDMGMHCQVNPKTGELSMVASFGLTPECCRTVREDPSVLTLARIVARTGIPFVADEQRLQGENDRSLAHRVGARAFVAHPLLSEDGSVLGTLAFVSTRRERFEPDEVDFLEALAHFVALAGERSSAETRLRESELRLRRLSDAAFEAIVISQTGMVKDANTAASELFGYSPDEIHDLPVMELIAPESRDLVHLKRCEEDESIFEARCRRKDGSLFWAELRQRMTMLEGRRARVTAVRDVTRRMQLEEQLRQSQKMDAIGRLAGGVAHDFNNLLTVISGYTELLLSMMQGEDQRRSFVVEIRSAGERAAALTKQLLAFSRKQVLEPRVLELNGVVRNIEKMLRRVIGEDVILETDLSEQTGAIRVDLGQMEQVLLNLAVNARDAMPDGGHLRLETRRVVLPSCDHALPPQASPGSYALLSVRDTGCGMTPQVMEKLFEPFFSTKAPGKGTGLGLATVFGIIRQSEGFVAVDSEVGVGTCFDLYFPAVEGTEPRDAARPDIPEAPPGSETILLVEDEDAVRELAKLVLTNHGYHVLEARNGCLALERAKAYSGEIDLLLTDVVMPDMGGWHLSEELQRQHPRMKLLFMSGYIDDSVVREGVAEAIGSFIQKPFAPAALAQQVRAVLDAPLKRGS